WPTPHTVPFCLPSEDPSLTSNQKYSKCNHSLDSHEYSHTRIPSSKEFKTWSENVGSYTSTKHLVSSNL
ncbi:MAG: hypothetical protein ACK55Z_24535, partial [bacterium]